MQGIAGKVRRDGSDKTHWDAEDRGDSFDN